MLKARRQGTVVALGFAWYIFEKEEWLPEIAAQVAALRKPICLQQQTEVLSQRVHDWIQMDWRTIQLPIAGPEVSKSPPKAG